MTVETSTHAPDTPDQWRAQRSHARLSMLLPYLWPAQWSMRARVLLALALLAGSKGANVIVPLFYGRAVDALTPKTGAIVAVPVFLILAYGASRLIAQAFGELRDAVFARVAQNAMRRAGLKAFRHVHSLSLRFHLERRTGGLSRAIERGIAAVEFLLSTVLFSLAPTLVELVLVCGILWSLFDLRFAALTFVTVAGYGVYTVTVTNWRVRFRREMNERDSQANSRAIDSLLNYETVKYFGAERLEADRYDSALAAYEEAAVKNRVSLSILNIGQGAIIAAGMVAIMWLAADGVVAGTMSAGDLVVINTYLLQLYQPLNILGFVYRQVRQSLTDMEKLFGLMDVPAEVADKPGAPDLKVKHGTIEFDRVDFGYETARPLLNQLSFTVPAGATIAVVGPSGAGKSTITRLLFRFYDPVSGAIRIDGHDIRDVSQKSLRAAIGVVPQDPVLFNDTLAYNIAYGRPDAGMDEIEHAARLAALDHLVADLPDGYDTLVGERGLKLSGGEKQRVAIARALLKDPPILLFDEATSALDSETEKTIRDSINRVSRGRTTLIIAHRLSTVVDADEILVLDKGRLVERGRHAELVARGGLYAKLWARQQAEREQMPASTASPQTEGTEN